MENLLPFFLVLFAGVFFSVFFRRLHLPWVVILILGGIIIGPHATGIFEPNPTVEFLGQIGLVFLMFMAGMEIKLAVFRESKGRVFGLAFINATIPFLVGIGIGFLFGYGWIVALLLGIIFVSSSIAIVIPSFEANNLLTTRLGKSVVAATILQDVASLVMLSVLLQIINPITILPLPIFYILLVVSLIVLRWALPKLQWFFSSGARGTKDLFQQELRVIFAILIGTVVSFELLGLHPIIAGFFAGLALSGSIKSDILKEKLHTISYGIFIPTFFIIVGTKTDLGIFLEVEGAALLIVAIVLGSLISKFASGWIGGRVVGFTSSQSLLVGAATIPQLSTTLAVVFTAAALGLLDQELIVAMVILSTVTTFVGPPLIQMFSRRIMKETSISEPLVDS